MGVMSDLRDLRMNAAMARRDASKMMPTRVWDAMVWKNWRGYSRWNKDQIIQQAYERNPAFYAAANIIATTVSDIPIYVEYEHKGKIQHTTNHPILDVLNRNDSREEFIEMFVLYLCVTGESYAQIIYGGKEKDKRPLGLITLPSQDMTAVMGDQYMPIQYFEYRRNKDVPLSVDEIVYVRKPDLRNYFNGMSPAVPLSETIDLANAGITWNKNVALSGGIPPVIARAPKNMTKEDAQEVRDSYESQSGARNSHRLKIISHHLELENMATNPHDAEWKEAILTAMRFIFMSFGVSSSLMNDAANKTYNNVKDSRKALYLDACLPIGDRVYRPISRALRKYYDDNPVIKPNRKVIEALQEDMATKAKWVGELVDRGIWTRNEARVETNKTTLHDKMADQLIISNQASDAKTPDDPPTGDSGQPTSEA